MDRETVINALKEIIGENERIIETLDAAINVTEFLKERNLGELVDVIRKSKYPNNSHMFMVIARKPNKNKYFHDGEYTYSCWTSWDNKAKCLNYGHYDLKSEKVAREICAENFVDY